MKINFIYNNNEDLEKAVLRAISGVMARKTSSSKLKWTLYSTILCEWIKTKIAPNTGDYIYLEFDLLNDRFTNLSLMVFQPKQKLHFKALKFDINKLMEKIGLEEKQ